MEVHRPINLVAFANEEAVFIDVQPSTANSVAKAQPMINYGSTVGY